MKPHHYERLLATARRWSRGGEEADDIVQDALLEAVRHGRADPATARDLGWLRAIVRNRARMNWRTSLRRRKRETAFAAAGQGAVDALEQTTPDAILTGLPPALKSVAALALSGHDRREIAYLLGLSDAALRQRVAGLRRRLAARGIAMPPGLPGLTLDLAYGRLREALKPALMRHGGLLATHDPDGHIFVLTRSRNG